MGAFDFAKNAGAKIGIGKSTKEEAADKKEAAAEKAKAARAKAAKAKYDREAAAALKEKKARKAREAAEKKADAAADKREAEALKEHKAEAAKSKELEEYVIGLGLKASKFDIRFDDGIAHVSGGVGTQAMREKIILAVGNVEGVSKVSSTMTINKPKKKAGVKKMAAGKAAKKKAAPRKAVKEATMYTVKSGDTLSKIAKAHYGDASKYPKIFEANKPMLKDPNKIYPGQVLRIP